MPVSFLDLGVIGVTLLSALLAMVRGFTREVLSIASWIAAAAAAWFLHPQVLPYAQEYISNKQGALAAAIAAVFLITLIVVSLITVKISDFILDSKIGPLDRSLGFLFGLARGALICVIGFAFFAWFVDIKLVDGKENENKPVPQWVKEAKTRPILQMAGASLTEMLPEDPESVFLRQLKRQLLGGPAEPADREPGQPGPQTPAPARPAP